MPAYLITHAESRRGDILVEDDDLVLSLTEQWACLSDATGIVLAVPIAQVASVMRVDDKQDHEPAPQEG
ncbi:hypothetical protein [Streptomyces sp. NRRL F-6674]|uniref:hypothetical protein n=1 Tax=Streptomyces sp. NRRL F-6674 TaxID=1463877 RepID=UPI000525B16A|nr:hypothetical protein [Streptomyces sp. NRRL F-6674]